MHTADIITGGAHNLTNAQKITPTTTRSPSPAGTHPADLTNQRFGHLTALEPTPYRRRRYVLWRCRCDCGREACYSSIQLKRGSARNCRDTSCEYYQQERVEDYDNRYEDLTGLRVGKLVVVRMATADDISTDTAPLQAVDDISTDTALLSTVDDISTDGALLPAVDGRLTVDNLPTVDSQPTVNGRPTVDDGKGTCHNEKSINYFPRSLYFLYGVRHHRGDVRFGFCPSTTVRHRHCHGLPAHSPSTSSTVGSTDKRTEPPPGTGHHNHSGVKAKGDANNLSTHHKHDLWTTGGMRLEKPVCCSQVFVLFMRELIFGRFQSQID